MLGSASIPMALEPARDSVVDVPLAVDGEEVRVTALSLGNPHCAVFLDEVADDALVDKLGPALERHPRFPRGTNVEFVTVKSREEIRVRIWERGVGPTQSSGTCSASAAVAAILQGKADRRLRAVCDGGVLEVEWPEGGEIRQVGEAEILFEGDWLL
jgi:diaminopimelate epimerase